MVKNSQKLLRSAAERSCSGWRSAAYVGMASALHVESMSVHSAWNARAIWIVRPPRGLHHPVNVFSTTASATRLKNGGLELRAVSNHRDLFRQLIWLAPRLWQRLRQHIGIHKRVRRASSRRFRSGQKGASLFSYAVPQPRSPIEVPCAAHLPPSSVLSKARTRVPKTISINGSRP